jgi:hypothetical protein
LAAFLKRVYSNSNALKFVVALTTRYLDFWLLGGASLVVWLVMFAAQGFRSNWAVDQHFGNLTATAASLSLLVNYPHFLASYRIAYTRGSGFIRHHWWQLVAVPLLLVALFAVAWVNFDVRVESVPALWNAAQAVSPWGANEQILIGPRIGDVLFTLGFNLMILTIGWHYTKQVFGCMMVYARYDGYPVTPTQRTILRRSLLTVWLMVFVYVNRAGDFVTFAGFSYATLDLPDILGPISQAIVFAGIAIVGYYVFYLNYRVGGRTPSANMLVPYIALYVWWMPLTRQPDFYFLLVPLFHSLQYLPFVYRIESGHLRGLAHPQVRGTLIGLGIVLAGWLAFEFVPNAIDQRLGTFDAWGMFFFFTAAYLFINIHHYFIDNVIWRLRDAHVRAYLLEDAPVAPTHHTHAPSPV